jgi:hypothetical protein
MLIISYSSEIEGKYYLKESVAILSLDLWEE